jgi:2,3-bisphosphoglycerate-independent phosphoglycerate mutase
MFGALFVIFSPLEQIVLDAVEQVGGIYLVTADHGNAEDMVKRNKSGQPALDKSGSIQILTSHTLQPVSEMPYAVL